MNLEYEVELVIRRYVSHNGSLTEHPDEVEVFAGRKVFDPETSNIFDIVDDFKQPAFDNIEKDREDNSFDMAAVGNGYNPGYMPAETNFERYGE